MQNSTTSREVILLLQKNFLASSTNISAHPSLGNPKIPELIAGIEILLNFRCNVLYGTSQKVQAGVSFEVNPFHAGRVMCNNTAVPTNQYFYVDFRTQCEAQPNRGFQFSSWIENLESNSSRTINASIPSNSPIDWFMSALGKGPKYTSANPTVTKFGNFTANFEKLPPPIPSEYLIPLYGVIASSIVGWSIPSIVSWINAKWMGRRSNTYHKRIGSLYNDGKLDHDDIKSLDELRRDLSDTYTKGKISEQHYQNLKSEIGVLYEEIHAKRIDSLNGLPIKHNSKDDRLVTKMRHDIDEDFAKGKISEQLTYLIRK